MKILTAVLAIVMIVLGMWFSTVYEFNYTSHEGNPCLMICKLPRYTKTIAWKCTGTYDECKGLINHKECVEACPEIELGKFNHCIYNCDEKTLKGK